MKKRVVGLASAAIWLASVGSLFFLLSATALRWRYSSAGVIMAVAAAVILDASAISTIRQARRLPTAARRPEDIVLLWWFLAVVAAEIGAFGVANNLAPFRHSASLPALNVGIVGVHFLPLARIFRVPRYYALGLFFCAVAVLTFTLRGLQADDGVALGYILSGFALAPATWAIASGNLLEAARTLAA